MRIRRRNQVILHTHPTHLTLSGFPGVEPVASPRETPAVFKRLRPKVNLYSFYINVVSHDNYLLRCAQLCLNNVVV